jgi:hypothetical protein
MSPTSCVTMVLLPHKMQCVTFGGTRRRVQTPFRQPCGRTYLVNRPKPWPAKPAADD